MYGLQSSQFKILTELNHNDMGNPHPQYLRKDYWGTAMPVTLNQWTKIMDTGFANVQNTVNMFFDILLNVSSTDGVTNGLLSLQGVPTKYKLTYLDLTGKKPLDNLNMFALYNRVNGDGTNTYELWMSSFTPTAQIIITPIVNVCYPQFWTAYVSSLDYKMISTNNMYYTLRPFITETSIAPATLVLKNSILNNNVAKRLSVTNTATTIDVSNNNSSLSLTQPSATSITDFINSDEGQELIIYVFNANTTLVNNSALMNLKGGINYNIPQYGWVKLTRFGTLWLETSRSV